MGGDWQVSHQVELILKCLPLVVLLKTSLMDCNSAKQVLAVTPPHVLHSCVCTYVDKVVKYLHIACIEYRVQ